MQTCTSLMDGSFLLTIHHGMSIHSWEENMFMFRLLCVMESFKGRTVVLRNAAVDRNESSISRTSGNLRLPMVPTSFSPRRTEPTPSTFHLDPTDVELQLLRNILTGQSEKKAEFQTGSLKTGG